MEDLKAGTPVSLTGDGKAVPGAGTTIYRNITLEKIQRDMHNVKIRELDFDLAMVVYDGGIVSLGKDMLLLIIMYSLFNLFYL